MSKYSKLDNAIRNKIGGSPVPFAQIFVRDVRDECDSIALEEGNPVAFRILDRRLQALRKAGVIKSIKGKGWIKI